MKTGIFVSGRGMFINLNFQIFGLDLYFKMGYTKRNRTNVREKEQTMEIQQDMTISEKLKILTDAAKYDVACTSSGVDRNNKGKGM